MTLFNNSVSPVLPHHKDEELLVEWPKLLQPDNEQQQPRQTLLQLLQNALCCLQRRPAVACALLDHTGRVCRLHLKRSTVLRKACTAFYANAVSAESVECGVCSA